jgi:MacB-like periplasmic core domain
MYNDLRYAFRQLVKTPGFTIVAALSLALGIGANTTIFSALNALVYRPLPYRDPERLVVIWETNTKQPGRTQEASVADVSDWRAQNHVFEDIAQIAGLGDAGWGLGDSGGQTLTDTKGAERVAVGGGSPNVFALLGVKLALGRVPPPEEVTGHGQMVLISDSFWRRRYDGSPEVLRRSFNIEGTDCTLG